MKFSLSWLKDHLDTTADIATVANTLTMLGLEVESIEDRAKARSGHKHTSHKVVVRQPRPKIEQVEMAGLGESVPVVAVLKEERERDAVSEAAQRDHR